MTDPSLIYKGEEGFDIKFSSAGLWGKGIYFAERASYSDQYAFKLPNGDRGVFLTLVNLG